MNFENDYNNLIDFIKLHKDNYKELLSEEPYCITVKDCPFNTNWRMFSYSQFASDFTNPIVRCCRGSVFEIINNTIRPICLPFYKFCNYGEAGQDDVDWGNSEVQNKCDGMLAKCVKVDGKIYWFSNNGTSTDVEIPMAVADCTDEKTKWCKTTHDLINVALNSYPDWIDSIPENVTFMFELVSPRFRIIVPNTETKLWFLGARDNITFKEFNRYDAVKLFNIPFETTPSIKNATNIKEVESVLKDWKGDKEGVVICDKNFRRIKIKTDFYKHLKFIRGDESFTYKHIYDCIIDGSIDDAVVAFPEIEKSVNYVKTVLKEFYNFHESLAKFFQKKYTEFVDKKSFVLYIKKEYPSWFSLAMNAIKDNFDVKVYLNGPSLRWDYFNKYLEEIDV